MTYEYKSSCISRTGKVRSDNEDNFYFNGKTLPSENNGLRNALYMEGNSKDIETVAVFDGMGGELGGELAASAAAEKYSELFARITSKAMNPRVFLNETVSALNNAVYEKAKQTGITRSGTTAAILYFSLDQMYISNIGDSRSYRYLNGQLDQLSEDDVLYNPNIKNQHLTQYIGIDPNQYSLSTHVKKGKISDKELILLCTDGLYNAVSPEEICRILNDYRNDLAVCAEKLADAAENNGGDDNCTVILVNFNRRSWWKNLLK